MSLVEFEEWFEGNESKFEYPRLAHKSAKQAWNYQQGEVDKLKTEIDELQKRIDDASNKIDFWVGGKNGDAIHVAKSIGNILKGNKDEN